MVTWLNVREVGSLVDQCWPPLWRWQSPEGDDCSEQANAPGNSAWGVSFAFLLWLGCRDSNPNYLIQNQMDTCSYSTTAFSNPLSGRDNCTLRSQNTASLAVRLAVKRPVWLSGRKKEQHRQGYIKSLHNNSSECLRRTIPGIETYVEHSTFRAISLFESISLQLIIRTIRTISCRRKPRTLTSSGHSVNGVAWGSFGWYREFSGEQLAHPRISRRSTPQKLLLVAPLMTMDHGASMATRQVCTQLTGYPSLRSNEQGREPNSGFVGASLVVVEEVKAAHIDHSCGSSAPLPESEKVFNRTAGGHRGRRFLPAGRPAAFCVVSGIDGGGEACC